MANKQTTNVWYIDTAGATVLDSKPMYVRLVRWVSPSANPGDLLQLQDQNGNPWWGDCALGPDLVSPSPYFARNFPNAGSKVDDRLLVSGLIAATIGSGAVYIYFDRT